MTRVLCVFGTRPEAIKMAPVVAELQSRPGCVCQVCVTAQHREMLDDVLATFDIKPRWDLNVMKAGQRPQQVLARLLTGLTEVVRADRPDWMLVQGDTTSTLAASMAAFHEHVRLGHVEAGLRTWDKTHPFPEELNRRLVSVVADHHFAPTAGAVENLLREGIPSQTVTLTGNTVVDALLSVSAQPPAPGADPLLNGGPGKVISVTAHRRESFGAPMSGICRAVARLASTYPEVRVVFPVHPNPRVGEAVAKELDGLPNVSLLPPLDYRTFAHLLKGSFLVLTDSGGIQEEAPTFGVPVLVLRDVTERPEAVKAGTARLVGTDPEVIFREACRLIDDPAEYRRMSAGGNPFGDGMASRRIADIVLDRPASVIPFSVG